MSSGTRQADPVRQRQASLWPYRQPASLVLALLLCSAITVGAAAPTGCAIGSSRRRLRQDNSTANPVIETVEVDVVSQECVILQNTSYDVDPQRGARELVAPGSNLQDSARACCSSCHDYEGCNTFQWCPALEGCFLGDEAFPYRGCQLIDLTGFLNTSINTGQLKEAGPNVPFVAGSPLFFSVPKLSGYDVEVGRNFGGRFSYSCPQSLANNTCLIVGDAEELGTACDADPLCLAFSYYPKGSPRFPDTPFGVLKGGEDVSITSADTELNPNAAIYIKLPPADASGGLAAADEGGGSNTVVIAAVVGSVVGTAALAAAVLGFVYVRYRRLKASVADDRKPPGVAIPEGENGEICLAAMHDDELGSGGSGPVLDLSSAGGGSPMANGGGSGGEQSAAGSYSSHDGGSAAVGASTASAAGASHRSPAAYSGASGASGGHSWGAHNAAAGTARELLEVFARMYSQRPAVDYAVVAEMLDQDADPRAVAAAESADEERLRRIDAAAAAVRVSRSPSAPASGSGGGSSVPAPDAQLVAMYAAAAAQLQQQQQQQQEAAVLPQGPVQGPAAVPGSAQLDQEQSLLPGMASPGGGSSLLPPAAWALQPEEVEICKRPDGTYWQLGTGAFGTCYKGLYHGQQLVAVKVLHRVEERRRGEEFEREVALLKDLRDRNIVQFIGACLDGPAPMLVTEFMEFGDLWRALPLKNAAGQRIFAWHKRGRRVLYDVAKGLCYLHHRRIVHLDLKSANILLSRHGTAKICDIGMARVLGNKEYLSMLSGMGTFAWSAPEVLSGRRCTEKVDLYSFGVVIWEVCTGDVPVRGEMRPLVAPQDCPQEVVDLYERCIAEQPEQRPTAAELLQTLAAQL
ncbi:hypothetical protein ABPG77_009968 [Micractinium sp. CCAP 211/92]